LAASAFAYSAIKLAGALYLMVLGVFALIQGGGALSGLPEQRASASRRRAFVQGFVNDLLNPKSAILYVALIPQFVPGSRPAFADVLVLVGVNNVLALVWFVTVALFVSHVRDWLGRRRAALSEAADGAHGGGARLFHLADGCRSISVDEPCVRPRERLFQRGRVDHF
jgi:threonine/homoserine/homoserine lactone efflux protein